MELPGKLFKLFLLLCLLLIPNNSYALSLIRTDTVQIHHPLDSLEPAMVNLQNSGFEHYYQGDYENAAIDFRKSLDIAEKLYTETDERLADYYLNLGAIYIELWNFQLALDLMDKAEWIYSNIDPNHMGVGSISINKGIVYKRNRDFSKAILYYNHGINLLINQQEINYDQLYRSYRNLSSLYYELNEFEKSIEYNDKSILYDKSKSDEKLASYYSLSALNYSMLKKYELANKYYQDALTLSEIISKNNPDFTTIDLIMDYGVFQMDHMKDLDYARNLLTESHLGHISKYGEKHQKTTVSYQNLGELFFHFGKVDSSLHFLQKSLISAIPDFNDLNINQNPKLDVNYHKTRILYTLKWKAKALEENYELKNQLEDLKFCLTTYLLAFDFIDQMRLMYDSETSNFLISEQEDETYLEGIRIAEKLYSITSEKGYLDKAFQINEKRKSFTLLTSIRKTQAKEFGGIPSSLIKQESELYRLLAAYEEHIFAEKTKKIPNQNKINFWEEERFTIYSKYEDLIKTFENEYPEYYRLKYDASTISLEQIEDYIRPEQILIEYALSDSNLFIFTIGRNHSQLFKHTIDSSIFSSINFIWNQLSEPQFSNEVNKSYQGYCSNAYSLYQYLLEPIQGQIKNKNLLIVPDGTLWYIPFEILLNSPKKDSIVNYRNLPYLIRSNSISYTYSATISFEGNRRLTQSTKGFLAFAPDYTNLLAQISPSIEEYFERFRENLVPIPGVKDEVRNIKRQIGGDIYLDEEATESRFKKTAGEYDILHLAMHTIVNNEEPMYSKLAFTQKVDSLNDGFLNTYEIYNSRYNARMAVLSSCKTGFGKLMKGEGVMSLARGFMYAGCPSIVMTLWEVSDKSGARLMEDFYKSLKRGRSKAEALREAKLDFLKNADNLKANPYFWSTYVVIGDSSPLFKKNLSYLYWLGAILLIGALGLLLYIRKQRIIKGREAFKPDSLLS